MSVSPSGPGSSAPASPVAACAQRVLAGLTPAQQVGQLLLMGLASNRLGDAERAAIRNQHVGSVWFTAFSTAGAAAIRSVSDAVQAEATVAATGGIRFLVAANQEGGRIQALQGIGFSTIPTALVQGTMSPSELAADAARWGRELLAAGVNLNFAPVSDVVPPGGDATNQPIGVLQREYGHDPATVADHAPAFQAGMAAASVLTTTKHFPGLGRVVGNTDLVAAVVDTTTTIDDPYLLPFRVAVATGIPFVMVALATYTQIDPAHLAAFSPVVMRTLLRDRLGFRGVVMSDDLGATAAVAAIPAGQRAIDFVTAGGDLIVSKTAAATVEMTAALQARVAADAGLAARVADAAGRILEIKAQAGLLTCPS